jgi:hypothetical protein
LTPAAPERVRSFHSEIGIRDIRQGICDACNSIRRRELPPHRIVARRFYLPTQRFSGVPEAAISHEA